MPLNFFRIFCSISVAFILLQRSEGSALSIFEQKKYKKLTDGQGLYSSKDDVEILGVDNFKHEIYGNERAFLVEFYNSWCGFCRRFAPSWKALATDVKEWKGLVGIGAVDCSDDVNNPLCRDFEIMSYPTIKYFHENYQEGPKNLGKVIQAGSDMNEHRQKLIEIIQREQYEGRGKMFPSLFPYNNPNVNLLFDDAPKNAKYAFLIFQNPSSFLAQEIALDFNKIKDVVVRYTFNNNSELMNALQVSTIPALVSIGRDSSVQTLTSSESREAYSTAIRQFLKSKHIIVPGKVHEQAPVEKWVDSKVPDMKEFMQEREREALKEKVKKMGDVIFQMDLETVLRYSLKHEVGNSKEITGEKLKALSDYMNILERHFPFGKYGQLFLKEIKNHISQKTFIHGSEIRKMVEDAEREERQVFSTPQKWLACKGSKTTYRGYPCGLWKMFHYLTVNAADYSGIKDDNPKIVLEAMHGYIKHFFGCAECSKHFQQMADRRKIFEVSSWDDSILWLWSAHNEVNKRLSGDETEDPDYPKYQFPSDKRCPRCHNKDHSWNIPEVLLYLKHMYSSINVRYIGSDTRILHLGLNGESSYNSSESSLFKTIDVGLCFILYVASFLLLVILIRMFLKRGYKKKIYSHDLLGKV
nr:sulfhydryl oxidase 2 [Leptinotarsa decemlineata]